MLKPSRSIVAPIVDAGDAACNAQDFLTPISSSRLARLRPVGFLHASCFSAFIGESFTF